MSSPRDRFGPAFGPAGIAVIRKTLLFVGETHVGSSHSSPTSLVRKVSRINANPCKTRDFSCADNIHCNPLR